MSNKQIHYNIDSISKLNANFNLIYGEKSNQEFHLYSDLVNMV